MRATSMLAVALLCSGNHRQHLAMGPPSKLKTRLQHIQEMRSSDYDVIIIGGGATGAGVALECSQRGLRSALLEANDFSGGASSKSTKLVHGGVRYLQQVFELSEKNRQEKFGLVVDALRERSAFLNMCSHLTNQFPTLIPCNNIFELGYYYVGSLCYHMIYKYYSEPSGFKFNPPRIVGREEIVQQFSKAKCTYGVLYYDGQFNDARMVQEILLTASQKNTNIANYIEVRSFLYENGRIVGVEAYDKETKETFKMRSKVVVNATGCFADQLRLMDNPNKSKRILPVAGSHLILPQSYGSKEWGYLIPKSSDGRVLYILPWQGQTMVGTTERKLTTPDLNPTVTKEELDWLINQYSSQFDLTPREVGAAVKSKWCGVRPLVVEEGSNVGNSKEVSRSHVLEMSESGLISVMGGKWTIFRQMGEETVTKILEILKQPKVKSISKTTKLLGGSSFRLQDIFDKKAEDFAQQFDLPMSYAVYYLTMYGDRAYEVVDFILSNEEYKKTFNTAYPHTVGEIIYLVRYEQACNPEDILLRRTRHGFVDQARIFELYTWIFNIMAKELKWSDKYQIEFAKRNFENIRKMEF